MNTRYSRIGRRSFFTRTVAGVAGLSVVGRGSVTEPVQAQSSSASDLDDNWTQYRADAGHTAYLKDGVGPTGNITQAWTTAGSRNLLGLAVVDETVYGGAETLVALNAADGSEQWIFTPEPPKNNETKPLTTAIDHLAVMNGTVYASIRFGTNDGSKIRLDTATLLAVEAATGTQRWRVDVPKLANRGFGQVLTANGTVFSSIPDVDNNYQPVLHAFNADGSVRWREPLRPGSRYLVGDGRVYIDQGARGLQESGVRALDAATGKELWQFKPRGSIKSTPMVADGTLFTIAAPDDYSEKPNTETVIATDAATRDERWRTEFTTAVNYPDVVVGTVDATSVYLLQPHTSKEITQVAALNRADGSERWTTTVPDSPNNIPFGGVARVGELLYIEGHALDPTDGTIVWTWGTAPEKDWQLRAVAGGRAYLSHPTATGWTLTALTGTHN